MLANGFPHTFRSVMRDLEPGYTSANEPDVGLGDPIAAIDFNI